MHTQIDDAALTGCVRAALAIEMLKDVLDVDRDLVEEEASRGRLMPEDVYCLHMQMRVDGKPVRSVAELLGC